VTLQNLQLLGVLMKRKCDQRLIMLPVTNTGSVKKRKLNFEYIFETGNSFFLPKGLQFVE
jgi:hypothetical protein